MTQMLAFSIGFSVSNLNRDDLESLFVEFGGALDALEKAAPVHILDHAVSIDLSSHRLEIDLTTAGDNADHAEHIARNAILALLEFTGGSPVDGTDITQVGSGSPVPHEPTLLERASFERSGFEIIHRELVGA